MLPAYLQKNDKTARWLIFTASVAVFAAVVSLSRVELKVELGFDKHLFAKLNAIINSVVSVMLVWGLITVKRRQYAMHRRIMIGAIILSCLFLISYICHHLFTGDTKYGGLGGIRYFYFFILITHIILAAVILPFILYTAYRGLTAEWPAHRRLAKITWPIWLYVSVTGVLVYLMISPYYQG